MKKQTVAGYLLTLTLATLVACGGGGGGSGSGSGSSSSGSLSLVAGNSNGPGNVDGTSTAARFYTPGNGAFDASGNFYVVDVGNNVIRKITSAGVVTLFAGTTTTFGFQDGTGTGAKFYSPQSIAKDSAGNFYIADSTNHVIRRMTPAGVVTTFAGSASTSGFINATGTSAQFYSPYALAIDSSDNIYVADLGNHAIRKITSAGVVTTLAGSGASGNVNATGAAAQFDTPSGIAVIGTNVYVADYNNHAIRQVTAAGVVTTFAGDTAGTSGDVAATGNAARFKNPLGMARDSAGNLYVTDYENHKIKKITSAAVVSTYAGAGVNGAGGATALAAYFSYPRGISFDTADNLYVADANHYIRKIDGLGNVSVFAGQRSQSQSGVDGTGSAAGLSIPTGMVTTTSGDVYIAEFGGSKIRKMTSAGVVTTFAGSGTAGTADGTGVGASFSAPSGIVVDSTGNFFVADYGNHNIRKITPAGVVTTFAGSTTGVAGNTNATGTSASFTRPYQIAIDSANNLYVTEFSNHTIRKITSAGVVTTFAGSAGVSGSTNATGTSARFTNPAGIATDSAGNVYVADFGNMAIRKITTAGVVTTFAGSTNSSGTIDATGTSARFYQPSNIAYESSTGSLFVSDFRNHLVRKITTTGVVTTVAGTARVGNVVTGNLPATIAFPDAIAVNSSGQLYISSANSILKISF